MVEDSRELLRSAWLLHQQGNLDQAERQYRAILRESPNDPDALHFFGILQAQRGSLDSAAELIGRAVELAIPGAIRRPPI